MDDSSFGPRLSGHFDFTLLFEHVIFHIVPSCLIVVATPFYICKMIREKPIIRSGILLYVKLAFAVALVAVQAANLALWCTSSLFNLDASIGRASATLSLISAVCIAIIVTAGHLFFLQSSTFLGLFLTATIPAEIVTTLTYHHRDGLETIARLQIAVPVLKLVVLLLEEVSKRSLIYKDELRSSLGSEGVAGFWNKSLLMWINPLLIFGFRHKITRSYLPPLAPELASDVLYREFSLCWDKRSDKKSKAALVMTCLRAVPWPFVYLLLPRILSAGFTLSQPFLIQDIVDAVSTATTSPELQNSLMIATAIVYVGICVSRSWYAYIKNQLRITVRAMLVSALYHKSLKISVDEAKKEAIVTLIHTDVPGVDRLVDFGYDTIGYVLEVIIGLLMLGKFVGSATIFALIPTIFTAVGVSFVARKTLWTRRNWNEHIANRVEKTSNVLAQIKDIKMMGLGPSLAKKLQQQFESESRAAIADSDLFTASLTLAALAETVTPVLVIAGMLFWSRASVSLTASTFFTTLAFVKLASAPLAIILELLPHWTNGLAALFRIQEYLALPEQEDARIFAPYFGPSVEQQKEAKGMATRFPELVQRKAQTGPQNVELKNMPGRQRPTMRLFAVEMRHVSLVSSSNGTILQNISLSIPLGSTTMLFGPVGCGKSTLLGTLIGEVTPSAGEVEITADSVVYSGQVPWLCNMTLQNNIIGKKAFDAVKYARVVYICALDVDFRQLPDGDQTMAGTDGCNLSGGQKARLALARSLYLDGEVLIVDDVFSALDKDTSVTVRSRLFGENGVARNGLTTVIMTTSNTDHLADADVIFRMDESGAVERTAWKYTRRAGIELKAESSSAAPDSGDSAITDLPVVTRSVSDEGVDDPCDTKTGDASLWTYFLRPAGMPKLVLWFSVLAIAALIERMPQLFGRIWMEKDPNNYTFFIGYAVFGFANPIMHIAAIGGFYHLVNFSSVNSLHWELADTTSKATFEYLMEEDASFLLNRYSVDMSMGTQTLPRAIIPVLWCGLTILIDIGVIASGASYAAPIIPCFLLVMYFIQSFYLMTSRQLRAMELDNSKLITRHVTETAAGLEHIRVLGWKDQFIDEFHEILDVTQKPFYFMYTINQWLRSVIDLTTAVCAVSIVSLALRFTSTASPASMGLALLSLISFSEIAGVFIRFYVTMEIAFGAVARIRSFGKTTPKEHDAPNPDVPEHWPETGEIILKGVTAIYKPNGDKPHKALDNISVTIHPGYTIGLVGRSGSGKSSLLLTLLHLTEYSGNISIDGRDVKTVPRDLLRERITTITQAGLELKGSVRLNLDPFGFGLRAPSDSPPTDEDLIDILSRTGLWNLVEDAGGLDTPMSKLKLSQGQKQLFHLSRAMLHHQVTGSKILLMDEGTASMDEETEARVMELMATYFTHCTKIIISHRQALLDGANVVLRMDQGRVEITKSSRNGKGLASASGSEGENS